MRFGVCTIRRCVSVGFKPDIVKLAVQNPVSGQPRLFIFHRDSTVADFENILKAEFPSVGVFGFYINDHLGNKTELPVDIQRKISLFDQIKDKELALTADGVEIGTRHDTSSSELKKRFIVDLAENILKEKLIGTNSTILKTEFNDYLSNNFKKDFKTAIDMAKPDIEKRKQSIDAIISVWESFQDQFIRQSIRRSMQPVKILLLLSTVQLSVLFYLTFFVYDWNVVEPLAYMITLGLQVGFLAVYAFKRKVVGPEMFFKKSMNETMFELNRNMFFAEELYIKKRALENLRLLFK